MVIPSQRSEILARRLELVREYAALHAERVEIHHQFAALSAARRVEARTLTDHRLTAPHRARLRELQALSERLRAIAVSAQIILLEQQMLLHALKESTPPPFSKLAA